LHAATMLAESCGRMRRLTRAYAVTYPLSTENRPARTQRHERTPPLSAMTRRCRRSHRSRRNTATAPTPQEGCRSEPATETACNGIRRQGREQSSVSAFALLSSVTMSLYSSGLAPLTKRLHTRGPQRETRAISCALDVDLRGRTMRFAASSVLNHIESFLFCSRSSGDDACTRRN
jgi:hypothetical protein